MQRVLRGRAFPFALAVAAALLMPAPIAMGQAAHPALYVANNGNLEGSVTSFRIEPDGSLTFIDRLITGINDEPGTNAQSISLSPSGRFLATGHGTASEISEQLTIIEVHPDGTLAPFGVFTTPDSPLDLKWLTDQHLAVTRTSLTVTNEVLVYAFDQTIPSITLIDSEPTGSFTTSIAVDRAHGRLYAQNSGGNTVTSFAVQPDGTLTFVQTHSTGAVFPLGIGLAPDGTGLYAGGGISSGGNKIAGVAIDPATGALATMPGSPYLSPGASPKQVAVSGDGAYALVAHGTDATVRSFSIDPKTGVLAATGFLFDVGFQGSLSEVRTLGNLVFVLDNTTIFDGVRGAYAFTLQPDGALLANGPLVETQGISPWRMDTWSPALCPADLTGDGGVDVLDLLQMLTQWGSCPGCAADLNGDNSVDVLDLLELLSQWGPCP